MDEIDDAIKIIAWCNENIRQTKEMMDAARKDGDITTAAKLNGQLIGWTEMLEKANFQKFQQGMATSDATKLANRKKVRVNASE